MVVSRYLVVLDALGNDLWSLWERTPGGPCANLSSVRCLARPRIDKGLSPDFTVDSKKLEYGPGTIYAGVPSSLGFVVGGWSNVLASTVSLGLQMGVSKSQGP